MQQTNLKFSHECLADVDGFNVHSSVHVAGLPTPGYLTIVGYKNNSHCYTEISNDNTPDVILAQC